MKFVIIEETPTSSDKVNEDCAGSTDDDCDLLFELISQM